MSWAENLTQTNNIQFFLHRLGTKDNFDISPNDDVSLKVVTFSNRIIDSNVPSHSIAHVVTRELPLPRRSPSASLIIFGVNRGRSLLVGKVRDNITPPLVVVNAEGDNERLVAGFEAKDTRCAASAHGENVGSVDFGPSSSIGKVPHRLFDDVEECVGVGRVDSNDDGIAHSIVNHVRGYARK